MAIEREASGRATSGWMTRSRRGIRRRMHIMGMGMAVSSKMGFTWGIWEAGREGRLMNRLGMRMCRRSLVAGFDGKRKSMSIILTINDGVSGIIRSLGERYCRQMPWGSYVHKTWPFLYWIWFLLSTTLSRIWSFNNIIWWYCGQHYRHSCSLKNL